MPRTRRKNLFLGPALLVSAALGWLSSSVSASAQFPQLTAFEPQERAALLPWLKSGPIALAEATGDKWVPALHIAALVSRPADQVAAVIGDASQYHRWFPMADSIDLEHRDAQYSRIKWSWRAAVFNLTGLQNIIHYPPPAGRPELGHRIMIQGLKGDLGTGRTIWRVYPIDAQNSMLVVSNAFDYRSGNFVVRKLGESGGPIRRAMTVAITHALLLNVLSRAEGGPKFFKASPADWSDLPLRDPVIAGLVRRGDLVQTVGLSQGRVMTRSLGRVPDNSERVRRIVSDPTYLSKSLMPGSKIDVVSRTRDQTLFDWNASIPVIGAAGRMRMRPDAEGITVDATDGSFRGASWRVALRPESPSMTLFRMQGNFTPSEGGWAIRTLASKVPYLNVGLAAASHVMALRAVRHVTKKSRVN